VLTQQRKPEELLHQTFQSDWIGRVWNETFLGCLFLVFWERNCCCWGA
jgi:hypothetical protein